MAINGGRLDWTAGRQARGGACHPLRLYRRRLLSNGLMALLIFVLGIAVGFPAATLGVGFLVDNAVPMLGALMAVPVIVLAITGALFAYCWVEDIPEMVRCPRGRLATNEMMRLCHLPGNVTVSAPSSRSYPGLQEHDALQRPWPAEMFG